MFSFVRVREDRSIDNGEFGNDYDIAEKIFTSLIDPFTLESLWTPNTGYFEKSRDAIYMASNKYKRFIIKVLFKEYIKSSSIVFDMAAGRGADLPGYYESKVSRLLAMDIDATALVELIRRNIDLQSKMSVNAHGHDSKSSLKLSVLVANAAANPQATMHVIKDRFSLEEGAADNVVCNYAFHYMCINKSSAENALTFIYDSLKNDGHAIITVMNGQKIFDLLSGLATGESWSITEDSMEKYKIRKDFASDTLGDFGQMISVKLPMATEMYTEPLCNLDVVTQLAESVGLELVTIVNYSDKMGVFAVDNPNIANKLSAGDKLYCGLHAAIIFKKPAEKPKKKVGGFKIRK
jgi:SAM-dependent methyltransferase